VRTRTATSFLFLVGRAFSLGVTLAAPAVVISAILGWNIPTTVLLLSRADGGLHQSRRRAGGGVDRCQADVRDRTRRAGSDSAF